MSHYKRNIIKIYDQTKNKKHTCLSNVALIIFPMVVTLSLIAFSRSGWSEIKGRPQSGSEIVSQLVATADSANGVVDVRQEFCMFPGGGSPKLRAKKLFPTHRVTHYEAIGSYEGVWNIAVQQNKDEIFIYDIEQCDLGWNYEGYEGALTDLFLCPESVTISDRKFISLIEGPEGTAYEFEPFGSGDAPSDRGCEKRNNQ